MTTTSLVISVADNGKFEVNLHGEDTNLLMLLGGCEYAKNWLMERILDEREADEIADNGGGDCKTEEEAYTNTISVSKQEAINVLLEARQTLEQRLQTIVRADDRARFNIPRTLSSL